MLILGWMLLVVGTGGVIATYMSGTNKGSMLRIAIMGVGIIGAIILTTHGIPIIQN